MSNYKSTTLYSPVFPDDEALKKDMQRWADAEAEQTAPMQQEGADTAAPEYDDSGLSEELRDRCQAALDFAAARSANMGLPFDASSKIALTALGTGKPASLNITDAGMKMADDFVQKYPNLYRKKTDLPNGFEVGEADFGAGAYGPDLGETIKLPHPLSALLGTATVMRDKEGKVVGIGDSFDYDPNDRSPDEAWTTKMGMRIVNNRITQDCPTRVDYVPITGGLPIPGHPERKK